MKKSALSILTSLVLVWGCTGTEPSITDAHTGLSIDKNGRISNTNTVYTFPAFPRQKSVRDLFNYIYFQGDGIFFSFKVIGSIQPDQCRVVFINPVTGRSYPAERVEIKAEKLFIFDNGSRIYGFSLVGSVLDDFYTGLHHEPVPHDCFCCRDIPYKIRIDITTENGILSREIQSIFRIKYTD